MYHVLDLVDGIIHTITFCFTALFIAIRYCFGRNTPFSIGSKNVSKIIFCLSCFIEIVLGIILKSGN